MPELCLSIFLSLFSFPIFGVRFFFACYIAFLLQLQLFFQSCQPSGNYSGLCAPSSCGKIKNISYPFRLDTDPPNCGNDNYTLSCENNDTSVVLYLHSGKFYAQAINYDNFTIQVADAGVQKDDCSSLPRYSLSLGDFDYGDPYVWQYYKSRVGKQFYDYLYDQFENLFDTMTIIKCAHPVNSPDLYTGTAPCLNASTTHSYVNIGGMDASDLMELCSRERLALLLPNKDYKNKCFKEIHSDLSYGFELSWYNFNCGNCSRGCFSDNQNQSHCIESHSTTLSLSNWIMLVIERLPPL